MARLVDHLRRPSLCERATVVEHITAFVGKIQHGSIPASASPDPKSPIISFVDLIILMARNRNEKPFPLKRPFATAAVSLSFLGL